MYKCPNCGAELRFDIKTQKLMCDHCSTQVDPYDYKEDGEEAERSEDGTYGVNVFRCPQCGGEIISSSTAAAEFCSYCGASVVLESRLSREKKPENVIPFKITKEDCKTAYRQMMKRAIFAPAELKDEKYIDGFRGIYMPYWLYDVVNKGPVTIEGEQTHRAGDYIITDHYDLNCDINAEYDGISYDASSTFDDNISEAIAPYDVKKMKEFTPAYLCGFYADTADVSADVYESEAAGFADQESLDRVKSSFSGYTYDMTAGIRHNDAVEVNEADKISNAMFPVWFLSYRRGNRVAYATINGETGKACSDMPVDMRKFIVGSALLALPIFIILAALMTVTAISTAVVSSVFALISAVIYIITMHMITTKENRTNDKGYTGNKNEKTVRRHKAVTGINKGLSTFITLIMISAIFGTSFAMALDLTPMLVVSLSAVIVIIMGTISAKNYRKSSASDELSVGKGFWSGYAGIMLAIVILLAVTILRPVQDYFYYIAAIISLIAIGYSMLATIHRYNVLATRRLPVFDRKGGDDRA